MNTQNLDYNEIAKENQIVANALSARDDEQQEVMAIDEQMEELQVKLDELQQVKAKAKEKLANADEKLFALATMAQDCKEQIEALKAEHEKEKMDTCADVAGIVDNLRTSFEANPEHAARFNSVRRDLENAFGIKPYEEEEHQEVQEELELAS